MPLVTTIKAVCYAVFITFILINCFKIYNTLNAYKRQKLNLLIKRLNKALFLRVFIKSIFITVTLYTRHIKSAPLLLKSTLYTLFFKCLLSYTLNQQKKAPRMASRHKMAVLNLLNQKVKRFKRV